MLGRTWCLNLATIVLAVCSGRTLAADLISEGLFSFPAQTEYVEYDNLESLRTSPNYDVLRQRFLSKYLVDAKATLDLLGIPDYQVQEVITGSNANMFFGLLAGTFSGELAARRNRNKPFTLHIGDTQAYCTRGATCILFLQDSLAAFGPLNSLEEIIEIRRGSGMRLGSNRDAVTLLSNTQRSAPVRGLLFGSQIYAAMSEMFPGWSSWKKDWLRFFADISAVAYSVAFDRKAHIQAALKCQSSMAPALVSHGINAFSRFGSMTSYSISAHSNMPFQILQVSSSGDIINVKADSTLP